MNQDFTTLICLFHHKDQAHAALEDILKAGVPEANVTLVGDPGSQISASADTLHELNVPKRDLQHLMDGLKDGGVVLTVSAISTLAEKVDAIFKSHKADKIDESVVDDDMSGVNLVSPTATTEMDPVDTVTAAGEELLLIPSPDGNEVFVYRMPPAPLALEPDASEDLDPREMGLDARMKPRPNDTDL